MISPEKIRDIRKRSGLTQVEMGRTLDVRQATISAWENGRQSPTKAYEAALRQWDRRLREMSRKDWKSFGREILSLAVAAGLLAAMRKIFGSE